MTEAIDELQNLLKRDGSIVLDRAKSEILIRYCKTLIHIIRKQDALIDKLKTIVKLDLKTPLE